VTLVATVFRRRMLEAVRYPVEFAAGIVVFYVIFLVLFLGAQTFGGGRVRAGDTLAAVVVGYIVFMLTQQAYQSLSGAVTRESSAGTLEQLALSRYGLTTVLLTDFWAETATSVVMFGFVLVGIMATTSRWLHLDMLSVSILLVLTMTGVLGFGLLMGGLALVFKRVGGTAGFLGFTFLALVAAPVDRYPLLKLLPVAHGNFLLRQTMVKSQSLFAHPAELVILIAVSAVYLLLGIVVFRLMDDQARKRALLGQY
jgi:ABC-2 type transport system permease protein